MSEHEAKLTRSGKADPAMRPAPGPATLEENLARVARKTFTKQVIAGAERGSAGRPLFALDAERFPDAVLVTAASCGGPRLRVAAALGMHTVPGANLVNACINDLAVQGAMPLYFQMQLITGEVDAAVAASVASGAATACRIAGCVLLDTQVVDSASLVRTKAYELAGTLTGICSRSRLLPACFGEDGDVLLGLPALGLHSSGNQAAQHLLLDQAGYGLDQYVNELHEKVGAALLHPHRSYLAPIRKLAQPGLARGFVHIAETGLVPSIDHALSKGVRAQIDIAAWETPPLFAHLRQLGEHSEAEMLDSFNMGIGLVAVVPATALKQAQMVLNRMNERHVTIGRILAERRSRAA